MKAFFVFLFFALGALIPYAAAQVDRDPVFALNYCVAVKGPQERVGALLADPEKMRLWLAGLGEAEKPSPEAGAEGWFYQAPLVTGWQIFLLRWVPGRNAGQPALRASLSGDLLESDWDCRFSSSPGMTRVILNGQARCRTSLAKIASPLLAFWLQKKLESDLNQVKKLAEEGS
jgi:hypothetical protein